MARPSVSTPCRTEGSLSSSISSPPGASPANRELSAISEVYDEWQEETGVKLIAVSIDVAQNTAKVKPLAENNGWPYEILLDPNGDLKRALGIQMIPYVFIVDGKGNIVYKHNGYTDGAEEELIEKVRELINADK